MKKIICVIISFIILISSSAYANQSGNVSNGGMVEYHNNKIYISTNGLQVYDTTTKNITSLYKNYKVGTLTKGNEYLYSNIVEIGNKYKKLGNYGLNINGKQIKWAGNINLRQVFFYNDRLYGLNELGNLASYNSNGTDFKIELEGIYNTLSIVGDYAYLGGEKIEKYHIPSKIIKTVVEQKIYSKGKVIVSNGYIYYMVYVMDEEYGKNVDKVYRIKDDGTEESQMIVPSVNGNWNVGKDFIYYKLDNQLLKMPINGGEQTKFINNAETVNNSYNFLYYSDTPLFLTDTHIIITGGYDYSFKVYNLNGEFEYQYKYYY